jgi:hypothetical protein
MGELHPFRQLLHDLDEPAADEQGDGRVEATELHQQPRAGDGVLVDEPRRDPPLSQQVEDGHAVADGHRWLARRRRRTST